ncbi:MAG: TonB-dependent receptor [Flavobacteriales bacterium]|nr:TonB-dependent receptor [Flavobacteriales bacterium]
MLRQPLLVITFLLTLVAIGQRGTITGTVTALENGRMEPQPFANVVIKGTTIGASTDLDGKYLFMVEPGNYTVVTTMVGNTPVEKTVTVVADQTVVVDLQLVGGAEEIKAVEVVKERRTDTETAVVMETRRSEQVVNGLGRQQIAKGQDRDAGDVVKRIPGVTLVNDRFVMIRGLSDRYNTVVLNDVIAPSMEPDKRAFSFDLIPSGALDRVLIYKTGAPELPGEFAGGVVKINTLSVPTENETKLTYSTSYRIGTTGRSFTTGKGSSTDLLAFDNGLRTLPSTFPSTLNSTSTAEAVDAARQLPNSWSTETANAMPDQRAGIMIARRFGKEGKATFGNVTTLDYALTHQRYDARNLNYTSFNAATGTSDSLYRYNDNENSRNMRVSVLHNWTALLNSRTKIEFRNLFNQLAEDRTTLRTGENFDGGFEVRNYAYRWQQRTIYGGQLHGSHDLRDDKTNLQWTLGYGMALSKDPDYRQARTTREQGQSDSNTPFNVQIASSASATDAGRFFSNLREDVITGKVDVERTLTFKNDKTTGKIRAGAFTERKDRTFDARWMSYLRSNLIQFDQSQLTMPIDEVFSEENLNTTTGFKLGEGTNPSDKYTAANTLLAGYVGSTFTFRKTINLSGGVRVEHNRQELASGTYTNEVIRVNNPVLSVLPSINASYNLGEKSLVRVAASQTVNRPEFRELAPFNFYDFSTNTSLIGNPDLKVASIINLDARWEFYPSTSELISVGVFYKRFTDPIETFFVSSTGGGTRNLTFANADQAVNTGVELEVRRSLGFLCKKPWAERWSIVLNGSLIRSEVDLGAQAVGEKRVRPMMGQSPYVANAGIYYEHKETRLRMSALWNVFGKRLFAVGNTLFPDIYEMPRSSFDITVSKGLGKHFDLKAGVQDILNQRMRLVQDSDNNGNINSNDDDFLTFRRGQYVSMGLTYKF